jgi:glucosylceramidase
MKKTNNLNIKSLLFLSLMVLPSVSQAQTYKALRISSTIDSVWHVTPASVSTTVVGTPKVSFNSADTVCTFYAWGTCFNELDWQALQRIPQEAQTKFYRDLFSPTGDLRFSIGRIPIGASDYAAESDFYDHYTEKNVGIDLAKSWYSCDEVGGDSTDFNLEHFTIARDKKYIIPYIKKALEQCPGMTFWASPWSPPTWMKKSRHYSNRAGYGNGLTTTYPTYTSTQFIMEEPYLNTYARYFGKFIDAYKNEGIKIDGICYQNEAYTCNYYPNTSWEAASTARFNADYLIPYIRKNYPGVRVILGTMNTNHVDDVFVPILNYKSQSTDPDFTGKPLSELFDAIGYQWEGRDAIARVRKLYPGIPSVMTEAECGNGTFDWAAGAHSFELIHHYLNNGCQTYTNWNAILGGDGRGPFMNWHQNGLLHLDLSKGVAYYTPEYYAYKHYSHFIGRGSRILKKSNDASLVLAAERPDGTYVVVVGNEDATDRKLTFAIDNDKYMSVDVPAKSYNTFVIGSAAAIDAIAEQEGCQEDTAKVTDCTSSIQNPTFATTAGWQQANVPGTVTATAQKVLSHQALNSWSNSFTSMDTHQDLSGLKAGQYYVTCRAVCGEGNITDQHAYISVMDADTAVETQLSPVKKNDSWDELDYEEQQTGVVTLREGQTLRIGYASTSNGGTTGWFAVTDFHLFRLGLDADQQRADSLAQDSILNLKREAYNTLADKAKAMADDASGAYKADELQALKAVLDSQAAIVATLTDPAGFDDLMTQLRSAMSNILPLPADGDYYIYNVGTGRYLDGGTYYGTRTTLTARGILFTLTKEDGVYNLGTSNEYDDDNVGTGRLYINTDGNVYVDQSQIATTWTLETTADDSTYALKYGDKYLVKATGADCYLSSTLPDDGTGSWRLVTPAARKATLSDATAENPVDATFLVGDPNYNRKASSRPWTTWTYTSGGSCNLGCKSNQDQTNWNAQAWHASFDLAQTVSNLPAGIYQLKVQGFYEADNLGLTSNEDHLPVFLFGTKEATFPRHAHGSSTVYQKDAAKIFGSDNGEWTTVMTDTLAQDGDITLGARLENNATLLSVWDNWQLFYLGMPVSTGINSHVADARKGEGNRIYSLTGQLIGTDATRLQQGIYIVGNRKIAVK